ncbi:MAG: carbonic anhydrase [Myxococcales bacterium]|nr:carbonic anhydrase [Myxococcales bacterium]
MSDPRERSGRVLSQSEQQNLTSEEALRILLDGNERFVGGDVTHRDHRAQIREAAKGQWPKAVILSCLDSRIPVEDVFDCGIGDLFVARVAGNFVNVDILGSMEFACAAVGAKLVFVLGHEHCGAIKGAIDGVGEDLENLAALLRTITPAAEQVPGHPGTRTSANAAFVHEVAEQNVLRNLQRIREESRVLRELEADGKIQIVGGMYDMDTGRVTLLSEHHSP